MPSQSQPRRKSELALPLLLLVGAIYLIASVPTSIFPFIISIALAYLLNPVVSFFQDRGFRRVQIVAGLYLIVGIATVVVISMFVSSLSREVTLLQDQWPIYAEKVKRLYMELNAKMSTNIPFYNKYAEEINLAVARKIGGLAEGLPGFLFRMIPVLSTMILVPFITFFLLLEGHVMINAFLDLIPSRFVEIAQHVTCEIDESLGNYLRGIIAESAILFSLALVGLTIMGLEYAGAIAIAMGISCLVPYVGPVVGGILGAIGAFVQFYTLSSVLQVVAFFALLRFIDDWFLQPIILERAVAVHPIVIVFSLLAGAELFGIWGVIFAMPVTCILKVFLSVAIELHRTEFSWKPKPEPTRISIPYV